MQRSRNRQEQERRWIVEVLRDFERRTPRRRPRSHRSPTRPFVRAGHDAPAPPTAAVIRASDGRSATKEESTQLRAPWSSPPRRHKDFFSGQNGDLGRAMARYEGILYADDESLREESYRDRESGSSTSTMTSTGATTAQSSFVDSPVDVRCADRGHRGQWASSTAFDHEDRGSPTRWRAFRGHTNRGSTENLIRPKYRHGAASLASADETKGRDDLGYTVVVQAEVDCQSCTRTAGGASDRRARHFDHLSRNVSTATAVDCHGSRRGAGYEKTPSAPLARDPTTGVSGGNAGSSSARFEYSGTETGQGRSACGCWAMSAGGVALLGATTMAAFSAGVFLAHPANYCSLLMSSRARPPDPSLSRRLEPGPTVFDIRAQRREARRPRPPASTAGQHRGVGASSAAQKRNNDGGDEIPNMPPSDIEGSLPRPTAGTEQTLLRQDFMEKHSVLDGEVVSAMGRTSNGNGANHLATPNTEVSSVSPPAPQTVACRAHLPQRRQRRAAAAASFASGVRLPDAQTTDDVPGHSLPPPEWQRDLLPPKAYSVVAKWERYGASALHPGGKGEISQPLIVREAATSPSMSPHAFTEALQSAEDTFLTFKDEPGLGLSAGAWRMESTQNAARRASEAVILASPNFATRLLPELAMHPATISREPGTSAAATSLPADNPMRAERFADDTADSARRGYGGQDQGSLQEMSSQSMVEGQSQSENPYMPRYAGAHDSAALETHCRAIVMSGSSIPPHWSGRYIRREAEETPAAAPDAPDAVPTTTSLDGLRFCQDLLPVNYDGDLDEGAYDPSSTVAREVDAEVWEEFDPGNGYLGHENNENNADEMQNFGGSITSDFLRSGEGVAIAVSTPTPEAVFWDSQADNERSSAQPVAEGRLCMYWVEVDGGRWVLDDDLSLPNGVLAVTRNFSPACSALAFPNRDPALISEGGEKPKPSSREEASHSSWLLDSPRLQQWVTVDDVVVVCEMD